MCLFAPQQYHCIVGCARGQRRHTVPPHTCANCTPQHGKCAQTAQPSEMRANMLPLLGNHLVPRAHAKMMLVKSTPVLHGVIGEYMVLSRMSSNMKMMTFQYCVCCKSRSHVNTIPSHTPPLTVCLQMCLLILKHVCHCFHTLKQPQTTPIVATPTSPQSP